MTRVPNMLELLPVDLADPLTIMPDLEAAISGECAVLPVPANDPTRADKLRVSMRAGQSIADDIAVVVATSGSTGTPKGAQLTPVNLISSADATHQALGGPGQWLLAMPAHHIAGLQVLVRSMVAGVEPEFVDLTDGFHTSDFVARAETLAATGDRMYTSLAPMQLNKIMSTLAGIEALRLFDAILVGGGRINPKMLDSAAKLRINVVTTYGSSETSGGCVYDGQPIAGAHVRVRDGRIHLGGPMIAHGYRNLPDHEAFAEPGWFITSDAGELTDGVLTVSGRLDNLIETGGLKLQPELLEEFMLSLDGVTGACVVGVPDDRFGHRICAAYSGSAELGDLIEAFDDLPRWQIPKDLRHFRMIPTTGPGKPDRRAVAAIFAGEV
ncbi:o-succinylbenzoate--CoA ligase [Corynebacterium sp. MSK044]|uniref:o-succinylbenzoate--CoA ligase n=1 Tax=Corynebacterium sp. MSK044 TaxID=3050195 RepID=UPI00254F9CEF|nr:o-succinylbenzoate--CoA ligase [Corynebacterium sp. MSK044]MDK8798079.1 o-succinylbenzoate--CoA ligase [Corynebacterium sp. MSK044]